MSNINSEQDDKATLEMLEMMGELPENSDSHPTGNSDEVDELLSAIDQTRHEEAETLLDVDAPETTEANEMDDIDLDDIDAMLSDIQTAQPETQAPTDDERLEASAEDALDDDSRLNERPSVDTASEEVVNEGMEETPAHDLMTEEEPSSVETLMESGVTDNALESAIEEDYDALDENQEREDSDSGSAPTVAETETAGEESVDEAPASEAERASQSSTDEATDNDNDGAQDNPSLLAQAADSVEHMQQAIDIDQEIQEIATEVMGAAQQATALAIATTQKAHASAEKTQKAIEATFAAAERAFEAAKAAGYSLESQGVNSALSSTEIDSQLMQIKQKNQQLKEVNRALRQRINELKP
jgi:hypothetical protein